MAAPVDRNRRAIVAGGALALVLGGAAGIVDRRRDDTPPSTGPATAPTTDPPSTTAPDDAAAPPLDVDLDAALATGGIARIGARYLADHPDEADADALLAALPTGDGAADPVAAASGIVADEYRDGVTVVVDGWVLARSEARAAALIALECQDTTC